MAFSQTSLGTPRNMIRCERSWPAVCRECSAEYQATSGKTPLRLICSSTPWIRDLRRVCRGRNSLLRGPSLQLEIVPAFVAMGNEPPREVLGIIADNLRKARWSPAASQPFLPAGGGLWLLYCPAKRWHKEKTVTMMRVTTFTITAMAWVTRNVGWNILH
jgi:hypothetical protein